MKLIIGLGNPGKKYQNTRHNTGYLFLDHILAYSELNTMGQPHGFKKKDQLNADMCEVNLNGEKIIFAKPLSFMNLSGSVVKKLLDYYSIGTEDLTVIADDIDMPLGYARIRLIGSSGGHKGIEDIIQNLKTNQFTRIKFGINALENSDQPVEGFDTTSYVVSDFSSSEKSVLSKVFAEVGELLLPTFGSKVPLEAHTIQIPEL